MALPTDPSIEARLQYLRNQIAALGGVYNPQREALAATSARNLTDTGYADQATYTPSTDASGNVTYRLNLGGPGQVTRDALTGNAASFNARGGYSSTARVRADRMARDRIRNARDAMQRQFQGGQSDLFRQQNNTYQNLSGEEQVALGDYASWRAGQPAAAPAPETPAPNEAASTPAAAKRRVWRGKVEPVSLRDKGWDVRRRGSGWVAIK